MIKAVLEAVVLSRPTFWQIYDSESGMPMMNPSLSSSIFICWNFLAQITARIITEMLKRRLINHSGVMLLRAFLMMEKDEPQIAVARMMPQTAKAFLLVKLLVILIGLSQMILLSVKTACTLINIIFLA